MCVCFCPFLLSPAPPLQHNPKSAMLAVHKMELRLWPDATTLVCLDHIYKVTAVCHSAKSTDIAAIMVNICCSWLPLSQGYRYRCNHGKYLLLPIATHHGLSITAIHGKYWWSIFCHHHNGSVTIAHCLAVHHSISTPYRRECDSRGSLLGWPLHK